MYNKNAKMKVTKAVATILYWMNINSVYADIDNEPIQKLEDLMIQSTVSKVAETENAVLLTGDKLHTQLGTTLGETLQDELGVSNQSFGAGVGTPVIRGQSGSRVKVMQNGLGSNDASTLSPDHTNGVEPINIERIEILHGADTLRYGSGVIGGVINVLDGRIPEKLFDKVLGGSAEQRFESATTEISSALKIEGSKNNLAYHLDGFFRDSGNMHIGSMAIDESAIRKNDPSYNILPSGALQNTQGFIGHTNTHSQGGAAGVSWISNENFIGVDINSLDKFYGIPPDGYGGTPVSIQLNQTKYDIKGQLKNPFASVEKINFKAGYTDYQHVELEGNVSNTIFLNKTYENRLTLDHTAIADWKGTAGLQTNYSNFSAVSAEGRSIVPKTQSHNYAVFLVEKLPVGHLNYELGGRTEWQTLSPQNQQQVSFLPISGSAALTWDVTPQQQWRLSLTHSQRSPQIQELFSNGFHDATHSYEKGDSNLQKETSNNLEVAYHWQNHWIEWSTTLFNNWVSDYIYQQRDSTTLFDSTTNLFMVSCGKGEQCFPILHNQQQAATFKGFETQSIIPLLENKYGAIDLTLFSDYTLGTFDKGGDVPRMPPLRYGTQLSYNKNDWENHVRLTRGEAQTHTGTNETPTASYLKLDFGTQYKIAHVAKIDILLFAKGKNLLNENIRNSTSYLRNFAPEMGRSGELGIRVSY